MARAKRPPGETTKLVLNLYLAGITSPSALSAKLGLAESTVGYHLRIVRSILAQNRPVFSFPGRNCERCALGSVCPDRVRVQEMYNLAARMSAEGGPQFTVFVECPNAEPLEQRVS